MRASGRAPRPPDRGQSTDRRWARTEGHFRELGARVGAGAARVSASGRQVGAGLGRRPSPWTAPEPSNATHT